MECGQARFLLPLASNTKVTYFKFWLIPFLIKRFPQDHWRANAYILWDLLYTWIRQNSCNYQHLSSEAEREQKFRLQQRCMEHILKCIFPNTRIIAPIPRHPIKISLCLTSRNEKSRNHHSRSLQARLALNLYQRDMYQLNHSQV